jgi:hypothetical protein
MVCSYPVPPPLTLPHSPASLGYTANRTEARIR